MKPARIRRETVAEQGVQLLRGRILERELRPGAAVTEEAMAREIGISRATMREVLATLTVEGLLTRNPTTRVLQVTTVTAAEIREIYRARRVLEAGGVAAYADRDDAALEPLAAATAGLVAAIEAGDGGAMVDRDVACHVATVALVGSTDLTEFYARLLAKLQLAMTHVARSDGYDLRALGEDHVLFLYLMRARRLDEARRHVLDRLARAEQHLLATVP